MDHIDDVASPPSIVQYSYDPGNRVTSRNYRNGATAAYSYNANDWVLGLGHSAGVTPIVGFSYTYDNEGNKLDELKQQDTTHSEAYQYDSTYRLINYSVGTLVGSTVPVPTTQTSYTLDAAGNWTSKTRNAILQTRVHNATNELVEINATALTYDANGNIVNDGAYTYAYDEENRLTTVTRDSDSAVVGQYQYDAFSRRVQKIADPAGVYTTTQYFYDDTRIVEEQNGTGVTEATYVYGNYVDEVLTMDRSGQTYYYHQNSLWSVESVTDSTATPVERYSYDAYGMATVTDGTGAAVPLNGWGTPHSVISNPWMFTGRQFDEEAGLYFYRARYYDAVKGRFFQRDPLESASETNLYEYVHDAPVMWLDPTGEVQKLAAPNVPNPNAPAKYCGAYDMAVKWTLSENSTAGQSGFVIQHIYSTVTVRQCEECGQTPTAKKDVLNFWEAWEVDPGTKQFKKTDIDPWHGGEIGCCTQGVIEISGDASFYQPYNLPPAFKQYPNGVWASNKNPHLAAGAGTNHIRRRAKIRWNCCVDGGETCVGHDEDIGKPKRHKTTVEKNF